MKTRLVPNERKADHNPRSKPVPYASRSTTVAMPQAMPSMLSTLQLPVMAQGIISHTSCEIDDHEKQLLSS